MKEDPPLLVLGGYWWTLLSEQGLMSGFLPGCPVQHQSIKRHLGTDIAHIRGRQSAPATQISANSENLIRNPLASAVRCLRGHVSQTARGPH